MAERTLITKIVRTHGNRADLYARGHQWPDLKLFDLSDLMEVGIDPTSLEIGQETPCRFWAIYALSEKLNKAGNPYKDIVALEPLDKPATTTSTDSSALLTELRAIRSLLELIARAQGLEAPELLEGASPGALDRTFPRYRDGSTVSENPAELEAYNEHLEAAGRAPEDVAALRAWVQSGQSGDE